MAQLEVKGNQAQSQCLRPNDVRYTLLHNEFLTGIYGKICVQAWLGYGEVLFIGFGQNIIAVVGDEEHPTPPIEIETHYADWLIRSVANNNEIASNQDERTLAEHAVHSLVGAEVVVFNLNEAFELTIGFKSGVELKITPWRKTEYCGQEAWGLYAADGRSWTAPVLAC